MPITWHAKRWWNFCVSEGEKKDFPETDFYIGVLKCVPVVYNMEALKHFDQKNQTRKFIQNLFSQNISMSQTFI